MNNERNREFHVLSEDCVLPDEFHSIQEYIGQKDEFPSSPASVPLSDEYQGESGSQEAKEEKKHRRIKRMLFMPVASAIAAVSIVFASFGYDPLGNDFLNSSSDTPSSPSGENLFTDHADKAFPVLSNLEPNGPIEGFGILNEEFICIQSSTEDLYLLSGSAWGYYDDNGDWHTAPISTIEGIRYDPDSNTLTLDNYNGPVLNVNLMGNSFTIRLIGDNSLDRVFIWGFHYGGSVKITGTGSLTVNRDMKFDTGIELLAEFSETCLMLDSGIHLEVSGKEMAVIVHATNMEKAIYYLEPLTLYGGIRRGGDYIIQMNNQYSSAYGDFHDYTIVTDEKGTPSKFVIFQ